MDSNLIALKLFLDELRVSSDIETIDDRKRVQKAIYLGQAAGADLGYRFGWYLMGPYSTSLTNDYFRLADAFLSGDKNYEGKVLTKTYRTALQKVRKILEVPQNVALQVEDWLELVSSIHFLRHIRKQTRDKALHTIKAEKPRLYRYANEAEKKLAAAKLLS